MDYDPYWQSEAPTQFFVQPSLFNHGVPTSEVRPDTNIKAEPDPTKKPEKKLALLTLLVVFLCSRYGSPSMVRGPKQLCTRMLEESRSQSCLKMVRPVNYVLVAVMFLHTIVVGSRIANHPKGSGLASKKTAGTSTWRWTPSRMPPILSGPPCWTG